MKFRHLYFVIVFVLYDLYITLFTYITQLSILFCQFSLKKTLVACLQYVAVIFSNWVMPYAVAYVIGYYVNCFLLLKRRNKREFCDIVLNQI